MQISLMDSYSVIRFQQFSKRGCKVTLKETEYSFMMYIIKLIQCPTMIHPNQWAVDKFFIKFLL